MKSRYFCLQHQDKMRVNENEALSHWQETLQRGLRAHRECRMDAAWIFLDAALDIALIRQRCGINQKFSHEHIVKPAQLLLSLMIVENRFNDAINLLSKISSAIHQEPEKEHESLLNFLEKQYERVETQEKSYLSPKLFNFTSSIKSRNAAV